MFMNIKVGRYLIKEAINVKIYILSSMNIIKTIYEFTIIFTGISYSYEYDNFKKTFETEQEKPKSSTIYQRILKEFNFFKRKAKQDVEDRDDLEFIETNTSPTEIKPEENPELEEKSSASSLNKYTSSARMDWSDTDTVSDFTDVSTSTRHLNSPKHKVNKPNHYSVQNIKYEYSETKLEEKPQQHVKPSSSKTSLINRFLRNVTLKKMLDIKLQKKQMSSKKILGLYPKGLKFESKPNDDLDKQIEEEIGKGRASVKTSEKQYDRTILFRFRNDVFLDKREKLIRVNMFFTI